jgi:hypothetical protein
MPSIVPSSPSGGGATKRKREQFAPTYISFYDEEIQKKLAM